MLAISFEKDDIVIPLQMQRYVAAGGDRCKSQLLPGATHFMLGQEDVKDTLARRLVGWARATL